MRGKLAWAGLAAAAALAGCAGAGTVTVTTTVTVPAAGQAGSSQAGSGSTSRAAATDFAIATVARTNGPGPYSVDVTFYRADGSHGRAVTVSAASTDAVVVAAGAVWYVDGANHLVRVGPDGSSGTLATLNPAPASARFAVSPDGSTWLWPVWTITGTTVTASLWTGGTSTSPRRVLSRTSDANSGPYFVPRTWTRRGPLVVEQPGGIGGRILYDDAIGQVDRLDVASGRLTKALSSSSSCELSDVSADGTLVCSDLGGRRQFRLVHPDGTYLTLAAPGLGEFGNARFDPAGRLLAVGFEVTNGPDPSGNTHVSLDLVDVASGRRTAAARTGLTPLAWTASGRVIADDRYSAADATSTPGYLVDASGAVTALANSGAIIEAGPLNAS